MFRKTYKAAFIFSIVQFCTLMVSCAFDNDLYFDGYNSKTDPRSSIDDFLTINYEVLSNNGLEHLKSTQIRRNVESVSLDMFFENTTDCFPVYNNDLSEMYLVNYSVFCADTLLIHFRHEYLENYVDSIIHGENHITLNKQMWRYKGKCFETISIIDSNTDEILYDNIMFNVFQHRHSSVMSRHNLTRSENNNEFTHCEQAYFTIGNEIASLSRPWHVSGHFETVAARDWDDNILTDDNGNAIIYKIYVFDDCYFENLDIVASDGFPYKDSLLDYSNISFSAGPDPYICIQFGLGYPGFLPPSIPMNFDMISEEFINGYGYSYKTHLFH